MAKSQLASKQPHTTKSDNQNSPSKFSTDKLFKALFEKQNPKFAHKELRLLNKEGTNKKRDRKEYLNQTGNETQSNLERNDTKKELYVDNNAANS